jgi:hypothetical protein
VLFRTRWLAIGAASQTVRIFARQCWPSIEIVIAKRLSNPGCDKFVLSHRARSENSGRLLACLGRAKSNQTVTIFSRRFTRKSKKKLTGFTITIKRPKH